MSEVNPIVLLREAIGIASNLAEELVKMEIENSSFWNDDDFYHVMSSFIASMKQYRGFEIEEGSPGRRLADAMGRKDTSEMSRHRFEIMSNLKALSGANRGGYMFFVFWPRLHMTLTTAQ